MQLYGYLVPLYLALCIGFHLVSILVAPYFVPKFNTLGKLIALNPV